MNSDLFYKIFNNQVPFMTSYRLDVQKKIIEPILKYQPELQEKLKIFLDCSYGQQSVIRNLAQYINLKSTQDFLFADTWESRSGLYKDLAKDPDFIELVQKENLKPEINFTVLQANAAIYKNKLNIEIIKKFSSVNTEERAKYKMLLLVNQAQNQEVFDEVMLMTSWLNKNVQLNNWWEEKLKKFPQEIAAQYKSNKVPASYVEEGVFYRFKLNIAWVIKNYKCNDKEATGIANRFLRDLKNELYDQKLVLEHINNGFIVLELNAKKLQETKGFIEFALQNIVQHQQHKKEDNFMKKLYQTYRLNTTLNEELVEKKSSSRNKI